MRPISRLKAGLQAASVRSRRDGLPTMLMLLCCCLASDAALTAESGQQRIFSNLQVLPEDISTALLLENMKNMTIALGAECRTCHRTDVRDFASDEIGAKQAAREMMRMVAQMNLKPQQGGNGAAVKTTCFSCHQGELVPNSSRKGG